MNHDTEYDTYKDFDMTGATKGVHPFIKSLQEQAISENQFLDADVMDWLSKQDTNTKNCVNTVIRQFMAVKTAS